MVSLRLAMSVAATEPPLMPWMRVGSGENLGLSLMFSKIESSCDWDDCACAGALTKPPITIAIAIGNPTPLPNTLLCILVALNCLSAYLKNELTASRHERRTAIALKLYFPD